MRVRPPGRSSPAGAVETRTEDVGAARSAASVTPPSASRAWVPVLVVSASTDRSAAAAAARAGAAASAPRSWPAGSAASRVIASTDSPTAGAATEGSVRPAAASSWTTPASWLPAGAGPRVLASRPSSTRASGVTGSPPSPSTSWSLISVSAFTSASTICARTPAEAARSALSRNSARRSDGVRLRPGDAGTPCGPPTSHPPGRDRVTVRLIAGGGAVPPASDSRPRFRAAATETATPAGPGPAVAGGDDNVIRSPPRSAAGAGRGAEAPGQAASSPARITAARPRAVASGPSTPRTEKTGGVSEPGACGGRKSLTGASGLSNAPPRVASTARPVARFGSSGWPGSGAGSSRRSSCSTSAAGGTSSTSSDRPAAGTPSSTSWATPVSCEASSRAACPAEPCATSTTCPGCRVATASTTCCSRAVWACSWESAPVPGQAALAASRTCQGPSSLRARDTSNPAAARPGWVRSKVCASRPGQGGSSGPVTYTTVAGSGAAPSTAARSVAADSCGWVTPASGNAVAPGTSAAAAGSSPSPPATRDASASSPAVSASRPASRPPTPAAWAAAWASSPATVPRLSAGAPASPSSHRPRASGRSAAASAPRSGGGPAGSSQSTASRAAAPAPTGTAYGSSGVPEPLTSPPVTPVPAGPLPSAGQHRCQRGQEPARVLAGQER